MHNRNLSARFKRQLFKPFRDDDFRALLTIDHSSFDEPYRFVSGNPNEFKSLTSNGLVFTTFPFEVNFLSDDDREPEATLTIQNVDDRIGTTILNLSEETLTVMLQSVLRETPDVIEYEVVNLELVDVEINAVTVSGKLAIRGLSTEPCPGRRVNNATSPVFFR
jgi:hypothetical protein